ncbi:alpha-beta hydrolase superfamily lysophospholipase [Bradymonas sediminis]|nr:alpha-beta hydrolase superfamily lysophospholipase [Bradymonas sediminis]
MFIQKSFRPKTADGWCLDVICYRDTRHFDPRRKPVLMIPGYAMNVFILNFHPTGMSMIEYLCAQGFEVWAANLRGQGASIYIGEPGPEKNASKRRRLSWRRGARAARAPKYGFRELSLVDFPCARDFALAHSQTSATEVHAIGCSLGGSLLYAYLAHNPRDHQIASMTAIGGPLRWDDIHPAMRAAVRFPILTGLIPTRGTRQAARVMLPVLKRVPRVLSIYMNAQQINLDDSESMVQTVEDPSSRLNYQIARWVKNRDLHVDGLNVTEALAQLNDLPILCIVANADGIVPVAAASSVCDIAGKCTTKILQVGGDGNDWYAHADLFVSENAQATVFKPMGDWLYAQPLIQADRI